MYLHLVSAQKGTKCEGRERHNTSTQMSIRVEPIFEQVAKATAAADRSVNLWPD